MPEGSNGQVHARRVAYHEAGHAVVAWRHGFRIVAVDMTRPAVALRPTLSATVAHGVPVSVYPGGFDWVVPSIDDDTRASHLSEAERYAQFLLAGNLALRRRYPHVSAAVALVHYGAMDHRHARNLALAFHGEDAKAALRWLSSQHRRAARLLREPGLWTAVESLAARLKPSTRLTGEAVEAIIARAAAH